MLVGDTDDTTPRCKSTVRSPFFTRSVSCPCSSRASMPRRAIPPIAPLGAAAEPLGESGDEGQPDARADPTNAAVAVVEGGPFEGDADVLVRQPGAAVTNLHLYAARGSAPGQHDGCARRSDAQRVL